MFCVGIILYNHVFRLAEATGHSHYTSPFTKRTWYCPFIGVSKEEWLASIKSKEQVAATAAASATSAVTSPITSVTISAVTANITSVVTTNITSVVPTTVTNDVITSTALSGSDTDDMN